MDRGAAGRRELDVVEWQFLWFGMTEVDDIRLIFYTFLLFLIF